MSYCQKVLRSLFETVAVLATIAIVSLFFVGPQPNESLISDSNVVMNEWLECKIDPSFKSSNVALFEQAAILSNLHIVCRRSFKLLPAVLACGLCLLLFLRRKVSKPANS